MKREIGNWTNYRARLGLLPSDEVDLHFGRRDADTEYWDAMAEIGQLVREKVRKAQEDGRPYIMFIHGWSTSRPGQMTARSIVRKFMRSKDATPFIVKAECVQHETVFVAKIRAATTHKAAA